MFGGFFAIYTIQFLHFKCLNTYWWYYSFHVHAHVHKLTYSCHNHYILSLQFTSVAFHSFIFQMKWEYVNLVPALFKEWIKAKSGKRGGGGLFHSRRFSRLGVQEKVLFQMLHPKRDQYPAPHFQSSTQVQFWSTGHDRRRTGEETRNKDSLLTSDLQLSCLPFGLDEYAWSCCCAELW